MYSLHMWSAAPSFNDPLPTVVISPFTKFCRFVLHSCISRNLVWFYTKQLFLLKTLCANFGNQNITLILWFQLTVSNKGSKIETDLVGKRFSIPCQNPLEPSLMSSLISLLQLSSKSHVHLHQPLLVSCCMLVGPWIADIGSLASLHLQAQTITLFRHSKTVCSP